MNRSSINSRITGEQKNGNVSPYEEILNLALYKEHERIRPTVFL